MLLRRARSTVRTEKHWQPPPECACYRKLSRQEPGATIAASGRTSGRTGKLYIGPRPEQAGWTWRASGRTRRRGPWGCTAGDPAWLATLQPMWCRSISPCSFPGARKPICKGRAHRPLSAYATGPSICDRLGSDIAGLLESWKYLPLWDNARHGTTGGL